MAAWLYAIFSSGDVEPPVAGGLDKPEGGDDDVVARRAVPMAAEAMKAEVKRTEVYMYGCVYLIITHLLLIYFLVGIIIYHLSLVRENNCI